MVLGVQVTACKSTTVSTSNSIQVNVLLPSGFSARSQVFNLYLVIDSTSDAGVFNAPVSQQTGMTDDGYSTTTEIANIDGDAPYEWLMSVSPSPFGAGGSSWQTYVAGSRTGALFRIVAGVQNNGTTKMAEGVAEIDSTGQSIQFGPSERIVTIQLVCLDATYCGGDGGTDAGTGDDAGTDAGVGVDGGTDAGADPNTGYDAGPLNGNPIALGDPQTGDINTFDLSADVAGNVAVAWTERPGVGGGSGVVRAAWTRVDAGWSAPLQIASWDGGQESLSIAAFDAGAAWIAWEDVGSAWVRRVNGFTSLATSAVLIVDGGNTTSLRLAASKTSGQTVLVYRTYNGADNSLYVKKNPQDGGSYGWGPPTLLELDNQGDARDPNVAMNSGGNYIVGWLSWATVDNVWGAYCGFGGGCSGGDGGKLLESSGNAATNPRVGIQDNNESVVVWIQPATGTQSIWSARYSGGMFGTSAQAWSATGINNLRFALGTSGGMGYATWEQGGGAYRLVYFLGSDLWSDAGVIAGPSSAPTTPDVAVDTSGNTLGLFVWVQGGAVRLTQINSSGYELISNARVSAETDGGVASPRVIGGPAGKAIILWRGLDGSRWNLYGNVVDISL